MSIATPSLDALRDTLPDELKDIRLNLSSVLAGENLQPVQAIGVALAAATFVRCPPLARAIEADLRASGEDVAAPAISDAIAAAGLMAMNTVYYRFRHMLGKESYEARSPRLRMSRMAQPATSKGVFEMMSLGCAALAGCGEGSPRIAAITGKPDAVTFVQLDLRDRAGVTAEFNRNLLRVLNRELGADFDVEAFEHLAQRHQRRLAGQQLGPQSLVQHMRSEQQMIRSWVEAQAEPREPRAEGEAGPHAEHRACRLGSPGRWLLATACGLPHSRQAR